MTAQATTIRFMGYYGKYLLFWSQAQRAEYLCTIANPRVMLQRGSSYTVTHAAELVAGRDNINLLSGIYLPDL